MRERGFRHEAAYLDHLRTRGLEVVELPYEEGLRPLSALGLPWRAGADVIVQAVLAGAHWYGRADVLRKVDRPSDLGDWSYHVVDTKLALDM